METKDEILAREIFKERFAEMLATSNRTQKQIAQLAGVTEAALSRYMAGDRMPKPPILANLANALHTTSLYLLGKESSEAGFAEIRTMIARSNENLSDGQRNELAEILLGVTKRMEAK